MFTDPLLQYQLNRLRHDELVREAERARVARQVHSTQRAAPPIWSLLRGLVPSRVPTSPAAHVVEAV